MSMALLWWSGFRCHLLHLPLHLTACKGKPNRNRIHQCSCSVCHLCSDCITVVYYSYFHAGFPSVIPWVAPSATCQMHDLQLYPCAISLYVHGVTASSARCGCGASGCLCASALVCVQLGMLTAPTETQKRKPDLVSSPDPVSSFYFIQ